VGEGGGGWGRNGQRWSQTVKISWFESQGATTVEPNSENKLVRVSGGNKRVEPNSENKLVQVAGGTFRACFFRRN
jgi:hypothetical protein